MTKNIGVVSLGCPKNLVDTEVMLGLLKKHQYSITDDKQAADILIVNTCGFIESAKKESIETILEMAECKKDRCELLIVTGCMAERYKDDIIREIPEVDVVLGTGNYSEIAAVIDKFYKGEKSVLYGTLDALDYLENDRVVSTGKSFAYVKIAEGCDNFCTYCIIPSLRGRYRSRKIEDIVREAGILAKNGTGELILVAQDTTRYGTDIYGKHMLVELLQQLSAIEELHWIRLLYCYPEEIDDALIEEMAYNPKICKYMDIPIQHASDAILHAMGRRGRRTDIAGLLQTLKTKIPGIVIRTSLIVGFPGETEEDFEILKEFVGEAGFDRLGVFTYSKEEDTPAAKMKHQVPKKIKQERHDQIMKLQSTLAAEKNQARLGQVYEALVEGVSEDGIFYYGRTYAEAPDIDGTVYFTSPEPLEAGRFVNIKILNIQDYDLIGEVIDESTK